MNATHSFYNGMPASDITGAVWRKSGRSTSGNCVELAALPDGSVAARNSNDPDGPALIYTPGEIGAFVGGVKDGEFDDLLM
ncbi:DUF397 domain-containing protein [Streptosporangium sandarakinum]